MMHSLKITPQMLRSNPDQVCFILNKMLGNIDSDKPVKILVDASMSDTSENPVQNKAIKEYIDESVASGATVEVGYTKTGEVGTDAIVTNSGTSKNGVFNFTIPRGDVGPRGEKGDKGAPGKDGANGLPGKDGANGKDALINGVNTVNILSGSNINVAQSGTDLTINSTVPGNLAGFTNDLVGLMALPNDTVPAEDTPLAWKDLVGSTNANFTFLTKNGFAEQPTSSGLLQNFITGDDIQQVYYAASNGRAYYRVGEISTGWYRTYFRKNIDSLNITSSVEDAFPENWKLVETFYSNDVTRTTTDKIIGAKAVKIIVTGEATNDNTVSILALDANKSAIATHYSWMGMNEAGVADNSVNNVGSRGEIATIPVKTNDSFTLEITTKCDEAHATKRMWQGMSSTGNGAIRNHTATQDTVGFPSYVRFDPDGTLKYIRVEVWTTA